MNIRRDKANYYLDIAETVLIRSSCIRRNFGCVIVKNERVISTGYNGSPSGEKNCIDEMFCIRNKLMKKPEEGYEYCKSIHAEQNAIINVSRHELMGSALYLVGKDFESKQYFPAHPCYLCIKLIKEVGICEYYIRETENTYKQVLLK